MPVTHKEVSNGHSYVRPKKEILPKNVRPQMASKWLKWLPQMAFCNKAKKYSHSDDNLLDMTAFIHYNKSTDLYIKRRMQCLQGKKFSNN